MLQQQQQQQLQRTIQNAQNDNVNGYKKTNGSVNNSNTNSIACQNNTSSFNRNINRVCKNTNNSSITNVNTTNSNNSINNNSVSNSDTYIVQYRHNFYDISNFIKKHPGGINTLKNLNNSDMTSRFMKAPPHSDAALYLMKEYKIKSKDLQHKHQNKTKDKNYASTTTTTTNEQNSMEKIVHGIELIEESDDKLNNNNQLDDSMEHLVDWSKAMVPQISTITKYYDEWVHKPVDRPLRLFDTWYLEMCSKTPWWLIPTFWLPVIVKCVGSEFLGSWQANNNARLSYLCSYFLLGILFWTFLEYSLHRWVFHMKLNSNSSRWLCTFHFIIHGLHHKVPFDPYRLVFPPLPGALIATIIYVPLSLFLPLPRILLGGALFGYLCYDLMHYYLHYGSPTFSHMYHMKRYHYQHHFAHQDQGYGISSPLWDFFFDTRIKLRKLRFQLRWK